MGPDQYATVQPPPQSSVEIQGRSTGPPVIVVKVFHVDPDEALAVALDIYNEGVRKIKEGYDAEPKRTESGPVQRRASK